MCIMENLDCKIGGFDLLVIFGMVCGLRANGQQKLWVAGALLMRFGPFISNNTEQGQLM